MKFYEGVFPVAIFVLCVISSSSSEESDPARLVKFIRRQFVASRQDEEDATMYDPYGGTLQILSNTDPETGITYISSLNRNSAAIFQRSLANKRRLKEGNLTSQSRRKRKPASERELPKKLAAWPLEKHPPNPTTVDYDAVTFSGVGHLDTTISSATDKWRINANSQQQQQGQSSFPRLAKIPRTGFSCSDQRYPGYYADSEAGCQVFHICQADGRHHSILCPNGTLFNQKYFTCDWWYNVDCNAAESFYELNSNLYQEVNALDDEVDDVDKYFVSGSSFGKGQGYKIFRGKPTKSALSILIKGMPR